MNKNILLLAIDGGGVRGKIAATILELLEKDLNKCGGNYESILE